MHLGTTRDCWAWGTTPVAQHISPRPPERRRLGCFRRGAKRVNSSKTSSSPLLGGQVKSEATEGTQRTSTSTSERKSVYRNVYRLLEDMPEHKEAIAIPNKAPINPPWHSKRCIRKRQESWTWSQGVCPRVCLDSLPSRRDAQNEVPIELYFRHEDGLDKYVIDEVTKWKWLWWWHWKWPRGQWERDQWYQTYRRIDGMEFVSCNNIAMLSSTRLSDDSLGDRERYWWRDICVGHVWECGWCHSRQWRLPLLSRHNLGLHI